MPDDFDGKLCEGSARFAAAMTPDPARLIRARGDQRRRRKAAGSVALALAVIAGGGGAYAAIGQPAHPAPPVSPPVTSATPTSPSASAAPSPSGPSGSSPAGTTSPGAAGTRTLRLGHLVLQVPATWRVTYTDALGDFTVSTGACTGENLRGGEGGSACPSFSLIAGAGATHTPAPTTRTYVPSVPYNTSTGVTGCPGKQYTGDPFWARLGPGQPYASGYASVTAAKTADYTVWRMGCGLESSTGTASASFYFEQRDWYLPVSRILIVDEYSTPGLARILATATWR